MYNMSPSPHRTLFRGWGGHKHKVDPNFETHSRSGFLRPKFASAGLVKNVSGSKCCISWRHWCMKQTLKIDFTTTYMAIYGPYKVHIPPYMAIYGPYMSIYGPYMVIYGPYMAIYGQYMAIYGPHVAIYGPYMAIYGPYMTIYGPHMAVYGPYMAIYGPYMDICGPYMDIYGPYMTIYGPYINICLLYTSPSPRDRTRSRMPSSA